MSKNKAQIGANMVQLTLPLSALPSQNLRSGSLRTFEAVRDVLATALKECGITREVVAKEVTRLTGRKVTEHHLNSWTASSKSDRSIPLDTLAALSVVTNTPEVAQAALECAGWLVLTPEQAPYYELGVMVAEDKQRTKQKKELWERIAK